ncbi:M28 family peptidase [Algibacter sp. L4_22]|uniref:M28 family peptidase n=1 Tax=Algibacter sp. L4_22 TaxID=2942477 RepID=UPI00201B81A9|nr:M28 family peptidase [Algibacter sp. L4_22]MCL5127476.1 M28 family peptidase [Algibacter sp. L4_22]
MIKKAVALLIIVGGIYWSFLALLPQNISDLDEANQNFSTQRALIHLKEISKEPHFLGSEAHLEVRNYIETQLQKLGLETQIQEAYSIRDWGNLAKPKNIIARIKGREKGKALLLLTHYDSNPHSSLGASDAGSGVVTILEGLRAFLSENKTPKNDIIILISDAEELGLNGADIFVNQHEWAKNIGLVLNFEARGSGGPSIMLVETNHGNAGLIEGFVKANPEYPVGNSLFYSIYKMLPNDTDLTRFREDADIDGFNFAFVDDHYDYHTAMDTYERLDRKTLEHQGSYLMPLLNYFSEANLSALKSNEDFIYFNVPIFKMVKYPFSWVVPMVILAVVLFIALLAYGGRKRVFNRSDVGKGFLAMFTSLIISAVIGLYAWRVLKLIYPGYGEILQGFSYNGHTYIAAFTCLSLAICFFVYNKVYKPENTPSLLIAPLFLWLVISVAVAFLLKGASFLIIPLFFGLLSLFMLIRNRKLSIINHAILALPVLLLLSNFVQMFPVGLGLKMLVSSMVLVVLIFGLLLPVFGIFKHKKRWSYGFFLATTYFLISAHINSGFTPDNPKPNSLCYILDADENKAVWATYDNVLDDWTIPFLGEHPMEATTIKNYTIASKYGTSFTYSTEASIQKLEAPQMTIGYDTIIGDFRHVELCITSQRKANRIEVFSDSLNVFKAAKLNGVAIRADEKTGLVFGRRKTNRLFSYYISDEDPLDIQLVLPKKQKTTFVIYETSFDLLEDESFSVPERAANMIPKPFVLNDAVIIKKSITIE